MKSIQYYIRHGDPGGTTLDFLLGTWLHWRTWVLFMPGLLVLFVGGSYALSWFGIESVTLAYFIGVAAGVWGQKPLIKSWGGDYS